MTTLFALTCRQTGSKDDSKERAMTTINKQWRLKTRPVGAPSAETWEYTETERPSISEGQLLIRIDYISIDPAMPGIPSTPK